MNKGYHIRLFFKNGLGGSFSYYISCDDLDWETVFQEIYDTMDQSEKENFIRAELYLVCDDGEPHFINTIF